MFIIIIDFSSVIAKSNMPRSSRPFFLHLLSLFSLLPAYADLVADRIALLRLSSSVLGRTLVWNRSQSDPCAWEGILCSNSTRRVVELRLPADGLSGQIPSGTIGNLTQLRVLSLRQNSLSGQIPWDIGLCTQLREINLRGNQFSGKIPGTLFSLTGLTNLDISSNSLLDEITSSFNNLIQLETLYLENNQLSGVIPDLSSLTQLGKLNVSNNRLKGAIPSSLTRFPSGSFGGNSLCGSPLKACTDGDGDGGGSSGEKKRLSGEAIAGIALGSVCGVIIVLSLLFIVWTRKLSIERSSALPVVQLGCTDLVRVESWMETGKGKEGAAGSEGSDDDDDDGLIFFGVKSFTLQQLLMAAAEVTGKGRFGTTYRAYVNVTGDDCDERREVKKKKKKMKMMMKSSVIVKRLKDVRANNVGEREFRERVEARGRLKHENLVPLLAYFSGKDERLLVYDDLGSGARSLASVLHGGAPILTVTWEVRRKVSLEIAEAIEYLHHHHSDPYFAHGSINSSNVLLLLPLLLPAVQNTSNNKFIVSSTTTAYLSEFGISPLVSPSSNDGYWAPEMVDSQRMTQKADVYSFGVLLFELLTGKDPSAGGGGGDLVRWVHESVAVTDKYPRVLFDEELVQQQQQPCPWHALHMSECQNQHQQRQQQMVELLHLGLSCTSTHPDKRPSMFQVRKRIHQIIISST